MKKKSRRRYTDEFKAEVLRAVENRGNRTIEEVAKSHRIPVQQVHNWRSRTRLVTKAQEDRGETSEQELKRLRRECAELKKDRDVLVKSIAVFVKERK